MRPNFIIQKLRHPLTWAISILLLGIGSAFMYQIIVLEPTTSQIQSQLETEFHLIQPLSSSRVVNYTSFHKLQDVVVDGKYISNQSYNEIRNYYHAELTKHGWKFINERQFGDPKETPNAKSLCYQKDEYIASLLYLGDAASYGWTYDLSLSWGSKPCS